MKHIAWKKWLGFFVLTALLSAVTVVFAAAETEGIFTYTVADDQATITAVDCSEVKDIVIPETLGGVPVTRFGGRAFRDNDSIRGNGADTLFIPKTVTSISYGVFTFSDIRQILVASDNPNYTSDENGVLFSKDMKTLIVASGGFASECYTVPDGVETIGPWAFHTCVLLEEIILPDSVQVIADQAFYNAQSLKKIHLNEGLTLISANCFAFCTSLETVVIPSTVTTLNNSAFTDCTSLKCAIISEGITTLNIHLFESDSALEYVYLPSTLESIKLAVFGNCTSLTDICYAGSAEDWANISIDTNAYYGDRPVVIDTCTIHYNVPIEAYEDFAFENDNDILTFTGSGSIPGGWHYWDKDNETVTTVFISGDFQTIADGAFTDFPELTTVILDTESTAIADHAFTNCPNLQAVLCFGSSDFSADAFGFDGDCKVYENTDAAYTFNAPENNLAVVPYRFSDKTLQLLADVNFGSYEFFDTMAAFTLHYDDIQILSFRRFTFDSIPMYYYPDEDSGAVRIEDNTLVNGEMYPMIYIDGEATPISFNALVNGMADKSITSFSLIASDENHKQIKDTQITTKDDDESGFIGAIKKAMRWVITLLNKLFSIISRFK